MKEDYKLFEKKLQQYFTGAEVSGTKLKKPRVTLDRVQEAHWSNLWREKAFYTLSSIEATDIIGSRMGGLEIGTVKYKGELVVRKREDNLDVDVMTKFKSRSGVDKGLTLEQCLRVPLNR